MLPSCLKKHIAKNLFLTSYYFFVSGFLRLKAFEIKEMKLPLENRIFYGHQLLRDISDQSFSQEQLMHHCDKCTRRYKNREHLTRHQRYECGKEPQFHCPHCPHRCYHKCNLQNHILRRHTGNAVYKKYYTA